MSTPTPHADIREDVLTLDKLRSMMAHLEAIPLVPFLASSKTLPPDSAIKFTVAGRDYIGAGPDFWSQFPRGLSANPFAEVPIHDLDVLGNEGKRYEFYDAMGKALGVEVMPGVSP